MGDNIDEMALKDALNMPNKKVQEMIEFVEKEILEEIESDEIDRLKDDNARLRARVEELEEACKSAIEADVARQYGAAVSVVDILSKALHQEE